MLCRPLKYVLCGLLPIIVLLTGCQTTTPAATLEPTPTLLPTSTPYPTYTPYPTSTPAPTYTPFPTWTPPPTATFTPEPTETPTPTATSAPTATPSPKPTVIPATKVPPTPAGKSVAEIVEIMRAARQQVEALRNMINVAMGSGYINCQDWVNTIVSIDATSHIDVSGHTEHVRGAYDVYRQGIALLIDGAAPMTENCTKFIMGQETKGDIGFQQWGTAWARAGDALPYIDSAIAALSQ